MELNKEFIEQHKLDEAQVGAITKHFSESVLPDLQKEWDGKANENAEGILAGAVRYATEKSGVKLEREQGEKWGDYLNRFSDFALGDQKQSLADKQAEIDEKLKNFKGGDEYKQQLETLQGEKDALLQQVAELDKLKGVDEKYKTASEQLSGLKLEVAFNGIKPNFPDEVNKYEASAKWNEFKKGILEKYDLEIVDGEAIAVDKENQYKQTKLSDLLDQDTEIKELLKGRQQGGTGATAKDLIDIEGLPFKVPKEATSEEKSALLREHLTKTLGSAVHPEYAAKFQELFSKMLQTA